jgi:hypothetical protein
MILHLLTAKFKKILFRNFKITPIEQSKVYNFGASCGNETIIAKVTMMICDWQQIKHFLK